MQRENAADPVHPKPGFSLLRFQSPSFLWSWQNFQHLYANECTQYSFSMFSASQNSERYPAVLHTTLSLNVTKGRPTTSHQLALLTEAVIRSLGWFGFLFIKCYPGVLFWILFVSLVGQLAFFLIDGIVVRQNTKCEICFQLCSSHRTKYMT